MADTLGLYLSIPFCRSKCTFCNFASGVYPASHHGRYVERVCEELRGAHAQAEALRLEVPKLVNSIYLGGGTPSVLEPELLKTLFATIRQEFQLTKDAEITMECAPGQIDDHVLNAMVECGVNRVSLGVQSFIDREAATSGRLHNRGTTLSDLDRLRAAGISRLNLDLIAGLPHQTLASWRESLAVLTDTGVEHASVYMLEVDDESRLGKEMLQGGARYHAGAVPKDDTIATMFEEATAWLEARGLEHYELSNYAVPGQESKHNLKYWERAPYLGIGLDAHSMLRGYKTARFGYGEDLDEFLAGSQPWQPELLTRRAELEEAWFLGLRLSRGVFLQDLRQSFSEEEVEPFLAVLSGLADDGLVAMDDWRVALTPRGKLLSNEVFRMILEVGDEVFCQPA
jgi:oxygen-independent coproporphyrinogen-3 oxidase